MLKVAHIITIYRGAVGILEAKLLALDSCPDMEVTVITSPPPADLDLPPAKIRQLSIPIARSIRPGRDLASIWQLYRLLRREKFDIVHTHSAKAGVIGALAAWGAGVPMILHTYHGLTFYEGQKRLPFYIYRLLEIMACNFRDHVFSQNRRDIKDCIRLMRDRKKVSFEGNGVDTRQVRAWAQRDLARARADFPPGKTRLALISRLEPIKRVDHFLETCSILRNRKFDFSAVIAGYGPLESALQEKIKELDLEGRVKMLGWAPHAASLLAVSDIVVLTSAKEGIPRSLIEAMALGKPIVATDVLGTQELVVNDQTGYLTPFGCPDKMADKIALLINNPRRVRQFSRAARRRVEENFNDLKIAARLHEFYISRRKK